MQPPKRVLCIMDMAGAGRSSLAVVLPVLAACGVQGCPLPTALFSTHTGGFGTVEVQDTTEYAEKALAHYQQQQIHFDAIYTGYLQSDAQFALAQHAQKQYPGALLVADPAMGDHGKRYSKITPEMVGSMQKLCQTANLITPNYTETALLLNLEPDNTPPAPEEIQRRLGLLSAPGCAVVATSVPLVGGGLAVAGCGPNGSGQYTLPVQLVPQNYPGTGDLFTAALVGLTLQGVPTPQAAAAAGEFAEAAAQATYVAGGETRHGVWFEAQLYRLTSYVNNL
ncbi:pyridoxamine kinase [Ruminococcaceae bacterium OttesenSCG-928-A16]|nr:pyridoxamine kinase [Ruminococcaceae bacterium OttesenSCG-928-A16]